MHDAGHVQFESAISVESDNRRKYFCGTVARSAHASALSSLRASLSANSVEKGSIDLVTYSVALRSDGVDAQADLELHCP